MKTIDFEKLSSEKKELVNKLMKEVSCSQDNAMFWLKFYSWDYERTKKYLSTSKALTNEVRNVCNDVAAEIKNFAEKGFKTTIRPTDDAVKKVNEMAEKFKTNYNSVIDALKENDWSFEKVENLFSTKQKEVEKNEESTISLEISLPIDKFVSKITTLSSETKIKIVKEIFASENEAFVKKLIKEMLVEQL